MPLVCFTGELYGPGATPRPPGTRKPELLAPVSYSSLVMVMGAAIRFLLLLKESSVKTRSTV